MYSICEFSFWVFGPIISIFDGSVFLCFFVVFRFVMWDWLLVVLFF